MNESTNNTSQPTESTVAAPVPVNDAQASFDATLNDLFNVGDSASTTAIDEPATSEEPTSGDPEEKPRDAQGKFVAQEAAPTLPPALERATRLISERLGISPATIAKLPHEEVIDLLDRAHSLGAPTKQDAAAPEPAQAPSVYDEMLAQINEIDTEAAEADLGVVGGKLAGVLKNMAKVIEAAKGDRAIIERLAEDHKRTETNAVVERIDNYFAGVPDTVKDRFSDFDARNQAIATAVAIRNAAINSGQRMTLEQAMDAAVFGIAGRVQLTPPPASSDDAVNLLRKRAERVNSSAMPRPSQVSQRPSNSEEAMLKFNQALDQLFTPPR